MPLTNDWWNGEIDWTTPAGHALREFFNSLPSNRSFQITLFGSAPLQLTIDRQLLSGDIDLFSETDDDLAELIAKSSLDKSHGGLHLELSYELSFRTSPRWRARAKSFQLGRVALTIPHPLDILIAKLSRLDPKDMTAFKRVRQLTGHPTPDELKAELQNAVDLFRPSFEDESPNLVPQNTQRLWIELFGSQIDVAKEIIAPAVARREEGYGEKPAAYKKNLTKKKT